jgi:hypothetical protein
MRDRHTEEAIDSAYEFLIGNIHSLTEPDIGLEMVRATLTSRLFAIEPDGSSSETDTSRLGGRPTTSLSLNADFLGELLEAADSGHVESEIVLRRAAAMVISQGRSLPDPLRRYIVAALFNTSDHSMNGRPGPHPWKNYSRNHQITMAIGMIQKLGFSANRACLIVAEALKRIPGVVMSDDNVREIWKKHRKTERWFAELG